MRGGNRANKNLRAGNCVVNFAGDINLRRYAMSRQISAVFAVALDGFRQRGIVDPQRNVVLASCARQHDRESGAPASAAENGDPAHAASLFLPKENFGSSPRTSRWTLPSCL